MKYLAFKIFLINLTFGYLLHGMSEATPLICMQEACPSYFYVAQELGINKKPDSWAFAIGSFLKKIDGVMLLISELGLLGVNLAWFWLDDVQDGSNSVPILGPMIIGTSVCWAGAILNKVIISFITNEISYRNKKLLIFFQNLRYHQTYIPERLQNLINKINHDFQLNHKSLCQENVFIQELYRLVIEGYVQEI